MSKETAAHKWIGFLSVVHSFTFSTCDLLLRPRTCHLGLATAASISMSDLITKKYLNELVLCLSLPFL